MDPMPHPPRLSVGWPRWRWPRLPHTILVVVVLPVMLASGLGIVWALEVLARTEEARLKDDLALIARAVRVPIGRSLERGDVDAVESALQSIFTIGRVYGASVYAPDGRRIAVAGIAAREVASSAAAERAVRTGVMQERHEELLGRSVFQQFLPLIDSGGRINGLLQIARRESDFSAAMARLEREAWIAWLIWCVLMATLVAWGHYRGVGRHVNRLLGAMQEIEQGRRGMPVSAGGPRELAALAGGFNRMLDGMAASAREATRQRERAAQLDRRLREQEKMAAVGRIVRGVVHELGAPLSVIEGRARRLLRASSDRPAAMRELHRIHAQSERLRQLVRHLLEYGRAREAPRRSLDPRTLARSACHALAPELDDHGQVRLDYRMAADTTLIAGDPRRLELALLNLLRNALQAAAHQVTLTVEHDAAGVRLIVDDDGPGLELPPAQAVEPFCTTRPAGRGTGLGLAIANQVADEHGGRLIFARSPAGGCRAMLVLPVAQDAGQP